MFGLKFHTENVYNTALSETFQNILPKYFAEVGNLLP